MNDSVLFWMHAPVRRALADAAAATRGGSTAGRPHAGHCTIPYHLAAAAAACTWAGMGRARCRCEPLQYILLHIIIGHAVDIDLMMFVWTCAATSWGRLPLHLAGISLQRTLCCRISSSAHVLTTYRWLCAPAVFLDVSKRGQLLDAAGCIQRYPALEAVLQHQQLQQANSSSSSGDGAAVVALWANMARTMVLAHQRRGESDLVAHWLYQVLALDSRAEEWAHAMQ